MADSSAEEFGQQLGVYVAPRQDGRQHIAGKTMYLNGRQSRSARRLQNKPQRGGCKSHRVQKLRVDVSYVAELLKYLDTTPTAAGPVPVLTPAQPHGPED